MNLERSGPLPVAADLGARRLAYRCTWERNCIKNAFSLAGFRRVKDGTELRALKGVRGEASPDGSKVAYAVDGTGYETYDIVVKYLDGSTPDETITKTMGGVAWRDEKTFYLSLIHI